jgi:glutathione S-transferase
MFFAAGPLEAAWTNQVMGFTVPPDRERMSGYGNLAMVLSTLEAAVSRSQYLAGDAFTAADVYVGSQLGFGLQFGMIEKRPAFVDYVGRLTTRPAAIRAKQIDDALTPATAATPS